MKSAPSRFVLSALLVLGSLAGNTCAHEMWIETLKDPSRTVVRFGEFGNSVEKSPGYLDQLAPVLAWLPASEGGGETTVVASTKKDDHFLLAVENAVPAALAQTTFPVMGKDDVPGRLPWFYLRLHAAGPETAAPDQKPAMILDLVPEGKNRVRLFFRAVPVAEATVTLFSGGEETKLTTDADGRVTIPECPAGPTLLTANQKEDLPGVHLGKTYNITSHNASLSWVAR